MRTLHCFLPFIITLASASPLAAATGDDPEAVRWLNAFMKRWDNWRADFSQRRYDDDGTVLDSSHGSIALRHPDRFRWEANQPYRHLIVANRDGVWSYDPDLQQAVVKSLESVLRNTPAAMLLRVDWPAEHYAVHFADGDTASARRLRFSPRDDEEATSFVLSTRSDRPHAIEWRDTLGGHTRVEFADVRPLSASEEDSLFDFQPPPNTDVIRE